MKIALIGYGKMGRTIEEIALNSGHSISYIIDKDNQSDIELIHPSNTDIAIEFTVPESAFRNLQILVKNGVKTICGTTGWLDKLAEIRSLVEETSGTFLYASNFSIGVNLFFEMNEWLAQRMNKLSKFEAELEEIHHTEKKDAPSGTAISIAEGIIKNHNKYKGWALEEAFEDSDEIKIKHKREGSVPGTHVVTYKSSLESIEIKHTAHDRKVFAQGVIEVAQWVTNQKGLLTIKDYIKSLV
ncbi:MAG: 4-hydroxy-tetrahydrodipicolinate reductase [Cyclobacteriaceae bacterium]